MKRTSILLLLALFLSTAAFSATGWIDFTPTGFTDHLYAVHFTSNDTGFAVGAGGKVLKTTDGGATWSQSTVGAPSYTWYGVSFPTASIGYIAGSAGTTPYIYKTTNEGVSWTAESVSVNPPAGFRCIDFSSTTVGAAGGLANSTVPPYANINYNPASWSRTYGGNGDTGINIYGISFASSTGFAVGKWLLGGPNPGIYKSADSGATWSSQSNPTSKDLQDVQALSATSAWAVGDSSTLLRTTDGTNWASAGSGVGSNINLKDVHFYDSDNGWAVGLDAGASVTGKIYRTTNGSNSSPTWTEHTSGTNDTLEGVFALDQYNAWAVGGGSAVILKYVTNPTITSVKINGRSDRPVNYTGTFTIEGTNFSSSATLGATDITFSAATISATSITGTATCTASGAKTITVYNPDTGSGSGAFTVNPLPTVTSASPASATQGQTLDMEINGTGFLSGIAASNVAFSTAGITINSLSRESQYKLNANITIAGGASTGSGNIAVTNPDSGSAIGSGIFSVNPSGVTGPTVTSLSPSTGTQGATALDVTITGSNFHAGPPTVTFGDGDIITNSVTYNSSTSLTVNIDIYATAETKGRTVTVTNSNDGGVGSLSNAFYVTVPGAVAPTISLISPNSAPAGSSGYFIITGASLSYDATSGQGSTVSLIPSSNVTLTSIFIEGTTLARVYYSIGASAAQGARDVFLINPDGTNTTDVGGFSVTQQVNPATSGEMIQAIFSNSPWNYNTNPNVIAQFDWPGQADTIEIIFMDSSGQVVKKISANVVPGTNKVSIDPMTNFGHNFSSGMVTLMIKYQNKIVGKGKLMVVPWY